METGKISLAAQAQLKMQRLRLPLRWLPPQSQLAAGQEKVKEGKEQLKEGKKQLKESQEEALESAKLEGKVTPEMITQISHPEFQYAGGLCDGGWNFLFGACGR